MEHDKLDCRHAFYSLQEVECLDPLPKKGLKDFSGAPKSQDIYILKDSEQDLIDLSILSGRRLGGPVSMYTKKSFLT